MSLWSFKGVSGVRADKARPSSAAVNNVSSRTCQQAIAEDALALLEAFSDRDVDEVMFRAGLLWNLAEQTRCTPLCEASQALQDAPVSARRMGGDRTLPRALVERVIVTAADAVTTIDGR
ncbi:hypothetical protein [Xanthomonas sp. NCPPB 2632]|jgi:hypothetical protein|uniref:hypothetical protein n=1 Tax=Xanthomonas sp. NCPPB 2632 TaxID=3240912 RepID=UPI0035164453